MELTVDGKTVFAATGGRDFDPARPVVVFIHGAGMDHTVWQLQTRYFAWHGRSVLALDMPGHGRSEGPALTAIGEMADWLMRLLDAARVRSAALAGHSMGALVAIDAAARNPDRVAALALCGVAESMPVHPELQESGLAGDHHAYDLITAWGFGRRAHLGGAQVPGAWMMGGAMRLLERGRNASVGIDLKACDDNGSAAESAKKIRCPTLFVLGDGDKMTPERAAQPLVDAIEGARAVVISDCGHMMMVEHPGKTLDALKQAL